jgi:hypothetical protein
MNVTHLFNPDAWPREDEPGVCICCELPIKDRKAPLRLQRAFRRITGFSWPGALSLNLQKDFDRLGIAASVPSGGRGVFCLACCYYYMKEFNRRNAELLEKERRENQI